MKSLQSGSAGVAEWIEQTARSLFESFPDDVAVLTGVSAAGQEESDQPLILDLVVITATAVIVGIDGARSGPPAAHPRDAGQAVVRFQERARLAPSLPVYIFWLSPPAAGAGDVPLLSDVDHIRRYVLQASAQDGTPRPEASARLFDLLLQSDTKRQPDRRQTPPLQRMLRALVDPGLLEQIVPIRLGRRDKPLLPADVNRHLREAMLNKQNLLEDVNYGKIVPNVYVVEINEDNYRRHYAPIEGQVQRQWRERLLSALNTANSRQGRKTYRFGGSVQTEIRPVSDLSQHEVRIRSRIEPDAAAAPGRSPAPRPDAAPGAVPCLEQLSGGRRWPLRGELNVIGRSQQNEVFLDDPQIQEQRLVSSRHAHIRRQDGRYLLFDGAPDGKPSLNGTFVNSREVDDGGHPLRDGDLIVLAALDPAQPRSDTPGAAALRFRSPC